MLSLLHILLSKPCSSHASYRYGDWFSSCWGCGWVVIGVVRCSTKCEKEAGKTVRLGILQAIVPRMAHRSPAIAALCCDAVRAVFEQDVVGEATREAVQLVADLVKAKKCVCSPTVVTTLLKLRLREAENAAVKIQGPPVRTATLHRGTNFHQFCDGVWDSHVAAITCSGARKT